MQDGKIISIICRTYLTMKSTLHFIFQGILGITLHKMHLGNRARSKPGVPNSGQFDPKGHLAASVDILVVRLRGAISI